MRRGTVDDAQRLLEEMSARPRPPRLDCWIFIERAIDALERLSAENADLRARLKQAEAERDAALREVERSAVKGVDPNTDDSPLEELTTVKRAAGEALFAARGKETTPNG